MKKINNVQKYEPSLNSPNHIFYKIVSEEKYCICDYADNWKCKVCEKPESYFRIQEYQDFWVLMYWSGIDGRKQLYKMNKKQKQLFAARVSLYDEGYLDYYFSTTNTIADIVVNNYFTNLAEIERYPAMFEEDFSNNYKIRIPENNRELLHLWIYFCIEQMVTEPCICGVEISTLIREFNQRNAADDKITGAICLVKKRLSRKRQTLIESLMCKYPYRTLLSANGTSFQYKSSENEAAYSYVYDNRSILHEKYKNILIELIEQGKISSRWKSEFSLFMLVKSYYIDAVYQYRSEWLQGQSLDIYIPEIRLGIEYQGIQHYKAIDLFGGNEGLIETQRRDKLKREKCRENGVRLYEWHYAQEIGDWNFIKMLKNFNYVVPHKQYADYQLDLKQDKKIEKKSAEVICQYDLEGNLLNQFTSVSEATHQCNVQEYMIRRSCSGIRKSAGGYQWRIMKQNCIKVQISALKQEHSNGKARRVIQTNLDGQLIATYNSIAEAVRLTGINSKSIRDAATGKQNHAGGFKWKYQE